MKIEGFDWDSGNSSKNEISRGIRRETIEAFFRGEVWVAPDIKHSDSEDRFLAIGRTAAGRPMVVAFTFRKKAGFTLIRPVSAATCTQRRLGSMSKRLPRMKSDRAAKKMLKRDLSDYIAPENFRRTSFEFAPKDKSITLRVSGKLLDAVRAIAKRRGMNYQKIIREAIERFLDEAA